MATTGTTRAERWANFGEGMSPQFRKKPVVIEAEQLVWSNWSAVCDLVGVPENGHGLEENMPEMTMVIHTLEGDMVAREGDWIIKGVKGECYPCKPDIFEQTYEPAEGD